MKETEGEMLNNGCCLTNIHPRDKKSVDERLALWALANDFSRNEIEPSGPLNA